MKTALTESDAPAVAATQTGQSTHKAPSDGTFAALRHRNFRLYALGMLVSQAGTWLQVIAQGWLVYEISQSARALGLVGFASAIPSLLLSPLAGVIADRWNKRIIMTVTQFGAIACAFSLAILTFTGVVQVWHIMVLAVVLGAVNAIDMPARQAFVVEMVGREDLQNAIALNSMIMNGARVVGPAVGGLLLAAVGPAWCFLINGFSYFAVIGALAAMKVNTVARRVRLNSPWSQLKDGMVYVREHKDLAALLLQALIFSIFGISYGAVLPAYVDQVLHVGASAYGFINAFTGIGAITAAYLIARYGNRFRKGQVLTVVALAFPAFLALFAWSSALAFSLLIAFFLGIGFLSQFTLINTLLQTRVDDDMRGRVLSLYTLSFSGFAPFGNLMIGTISDAWGLSIALTICAVITLVLTAVNLLRPSGVRKFA